MSGKPSAGRRFLPEENETLAELRVSCIRNCGAVSSLKERGVR